MKPIPPYLTKKIERQRAALAPLEEEEQRIARERALAAAELLSRRRECFERIALHDIAFQRYGEAAVEADARVEQLRLRLAEAEQAAAAAHSGQVNVAIEREAEERRIATIDHAIESAGLPFDAALERANYAAERMRRRLAQTLAVASTYDQAPAATPAAEIKFDHVAITRARRSRSTDEELTEVLRDSGRVL